MCGFDVSEVRAVWTGGAVCCFTPWRSACGCGNDQTAKLNGNNPWFDLKDVLQRLPTQPASRVEELLPHRWTSPHEPT